MSWDIFAIIAQEVFKKPLQTVENVVVQFGEAAGRADLENAKKEAGVKIDQFVPDPESEAAEMQKKTTSEATGKTVAIIALVVLLIIIAMLVWNS